MPVWQYLLINRKMHVHACFFNAYMSVTPALCLFLFRHNKNNAQGPPSESLFHHNNPNNFHSSATAQAMHICHGRWMPSISTFLPTSNKRRYSEPCGYISSKAKSTPLVRHSRCSAGQSLQSQIQLGTYTRKASALLWLSENVQWHGVALAK